MTATPKNSSDELRVVRQEDLPRGETMRGQDADLRATAPKNSEWRVDRQNLKEVAEKFPNLILDVIDSAYLAGIEANKEERSKDTVGEFSAEAVNIAFENGKKKGREEMAADFRALLDVPKNE